MIIDNLIKLKPRVDNELAIHSLIPDAKWDWFCLDNVPYHGKILTILNDTIDRHYGKGKGFIVLSNGKQVFKGNKAGYLAARKF